MNEKLIFCLDCGESNEIGSKTCIKCHKDLKEYHTEEQSRFTLERKSIYANDLIIYSKKDHANIGTLHEKMNKKIMSLFVLFIILAFIGYVLGLVTLVYWEGQYRVEISLFLFALSIIFTIVFSLIGINSMQFALELEGNTKGIIKIIHTEKLDSYLTRKLWSYTGTNGQEEFIMNVQKDISGTIQNKDIELQFKAQRRKDTPMYLLNQIQAYQTNPVISLYADKTGKKYELLIEDSTVAIELAFFYAMVIIHKFYTHKKY